LFVSVSLYGYFTTKVQPTALHEPTTRRAL
jgi:hypothetical protein